MNDNSRLYFEGHITLEPTKGPAELELLESIVAKYDMRVSTFLMVKNDSSKPDAFVSCRGVSYARLVWQIFQAVSDLKEAGFVIKRVKMEDTLYDTNRGDPMPSPYE